jgi:trehalose-phosphatase
VPGVERALAAWQARPIDARPLLLMDFDGTLVDFEVDPSAVRLPVARQILLQGLGTRADLTAAIVSGRRITDLRGRAAAGSAVFYAGLHGLEIEGPGLRFTHHAASAAAPTLGVLAFEVKKATKELTGVVIEDNGLSVVLHVRGASRADRLHALTRFRALAQPYLSDGILRVLPGDEMTELLPNIDWTKGDAVRAIIRHVESIHKQAVWPVYIGDDATDEDAFEEIGDSGLTIGVGNRTAGASFRIADPNSVEIFLRLILATD